MKQQTEEQKKQQQIAEQQKEFQDQRKKLIHSTKLMQEDLDYFRTANELYAEKDKYMGYEKNLMSIVQKEFAVLFGCINQCGIELTKEKIQQIMKVYQMIISPEPQKNAEPISLDASMLEEKEIHEDNIIDLKKDNN